MDVVVVIMVMVVELRMVVVVFVVVLERQPIKTRHGNFASLFTGIQ